ncbi:ATP-binding cassette domain-containing protein [Aggregicoccus sp. 17bor-14]|uniref:ABC transporter ATP-binding protein n=1 Tax=Myxococcaceae TaxID=31 RepID=UPI00129C21E7|nr:MULTISPECIES: ATP-binding cassette domain-containing protein [Myxococcaceae]MBF5045350.1 ATP-binding cassette domain-containing protein [Simulacricoccus sp. 17bor-14]MRI91092.1 ATP-binding cassette domain-containing protein [Aggregicoccus sp. 17bor-14]
MIEYLDVHKTFDVPVLAGLTLSVAKGERLSIVGPSGTGKSVLLKTTLGLIAPDRGDVRIGGQSVLAAKPAELRRLRRKVGYVFQNAALFDSLTVYENVAQGLPDDEQQQLGESAVVDRVVAALREVNLEPERVFLKLPSQLSGGMRKRVGLARALIAEPEVMLYDEPVTGLDPVNSAAVERLIVQIAEHTGATSVVVTHDIAGALEISHRIALLDRGRLRFVGTPDEFRRSEDPLVRAFAYREAAAEAAVRMMED